MIDVDSDLRLLYADVLVPCGYSVQAVADVAAAWQSLHTTRYDLLIIEQRMPGLPGADLVRILRAAGSVVPVVFATEPSATCELLQRPLPEPAVVLGKPFVVRVLLDVVEGLLGSTPTAAPPRPQ